MGATDVTALVGYGLFLMIPFVFVALPLTLWLLLNTTLEQIGDWHSRNYPKSDEDN
jgi:hypothetical protein